MLLEGKDANYVKFYINCQKLRIQDLVKKRKDLAGTFIAIFMISLVMVLDFRLMGSNNYQLISKIVFVLSTGVRLFLFPYYYILLFAFLFFLSKFYSYYFDFVSIWLIRTEADGALDKARKHKKRQLEDTLTLVMKKRKVIVT